MFLYCQDCTNSFYKLRVNSKICNSSFLLFLFLSYLDIMWLYFLMSSDRCYLQQNLIYSFIILGLVYTNEQNNGVSQFLIPSPWVNRCYSQFNQHFIPKCEWCCPCVWESLLKGVIYSSGDRVTLPNNTFTGKSLGRKFRILDF